MKPNDIGVEEEKQIVDDALEKVGDVLSSRQSLTSPVRIRLKKEIFDKGTQLWSEDLYDIIDSTLMGRYIVKKVGSRVPMRRTFRYEELQSVNPLVQSYKAVSDIGVRGKDTLVEKVDVTTGDRGKLNAIRKAVLEHKIDKNLRQVGIQSSNIVNEKRVSRKRVILDL